MPLVAAHGFSLFLPSTSRSHSLPPLQSLVFSRRLWSLSFPSRSSFLPYAGNGSDEFVLGDGLVYEDGVFEDPYPKDMFGFVSYVAEDAQTKRRKRKRRKRTKRSEKLEIEPENLVPEEWKDVQAEVNTMKMEQQLEFDLLVDRKQTVAPLGNIDLKEYLAYKEAKLAQVKPVVLDKPTNFPDEKASENRETGVASSGERVTPKNPRSAVDGKGFDHVSKLLYSENYEPSRKKPDGPRKLFTDEETILLNSRIPDLSVSTSKKWMPLHTLASSGELYLVDILLKHNLNINSTDMDGLTALHRAIVGKKHALSTYLLRESANPFALDEEGASLMHYAAQTASAPILKLLLLYNVDINGQDRDGWTPLHVAVQTRRIDIVKLLLINGARRDVKNKDGLTPLGLCLYSGRETRTYELIQVLK